jgi:hypothetical protein
LVGLKCELVVDVLLLQVFKHLLFKLVHMFVLTLRCQNIHGFKVKSANSSHERFFQTLLHVSSFSVVRGNHLIRFV